MKKFILLLIIFTFADGLFFSKKHREKMFMQFTGFIKFIFGLEEEKPIHMDVTFYLYTRFNPNKEVILIPNDANTLHGSHFNPQLRTVFVIHGYTDHKERDIIVNLRKALVNNFQMNVIVVDWGRLASLIYFNAASHACKVGKYVAIFLRFLENNGVNLSNIHLIGHSLGAQISGIAGETLGGKIGRITGLDPAGPLFEFIFIRNSSETLSSKDALFVDVIHTAGDDFGIMFPVGHVDFYPNDGVTPQPGCINILTAVSCSHVRSVEYLIESINGTIPFLAKQCKSFTNRIPQDCNTHYFMPMGYFTPPNARGIFYLETNSKPPFAQGNIRERLGIPTYI